MNMKSRIRRSSLDDGATAPTDIEDSVQITLSGASQDENPNSNTKLDSGSDCKPSSLLAGQQIERCSAIRSAIHTIKGSCLGSVVKSCCPNKDRCPLAKTS